MIACASGAAAAEMVLVMPLLLLLGTGAAEVGNFFLDEHRLEKSVRDAARYAARYPFATYAGCGSSETEVTGAVKTNVVSLVRTGRLSGGTDLLPGMADDQVRLTVWCDTAAGGTTLSGVYRDLPTKGVAGAPRVTVTANVPYHPIFNNPLGFSGNGRTLNASQQAAAVGL